MTTCVISDIHDNLVNLEKCLAWCQKEKIEALICCGDITNEETVEFISQNFSGPIYLVRGNMDIYEEGILKQFKNIKNLGRTAIAEIGRRKIGLCHEPFLIADVMALGACDVIFYGHTHKPMIEEREGIKIINPGTLGGVFQKATFAFYDTEQGILELKILEVMVNG
jgi:hypothetical protein